MPNRGTLNWSASNTTKTVSAGYYSGGTLDSRPSYTAGYNAGKSASSLSSCQVLAISSDQDQTSLSYNTTRSYKLIVCVVGAGDQGKSLNGGHATGSCSGFEVAVSKQFDDVQISNTKVAFGSHVFYLFNVGSGRRITLSWSYRGIGSIIGFN